MKLNFTQHGGCMDHIFYVDFDNLLREYAEPSTREDKLIKHKLDSIVALYDSCSVEEREFADEITLEFSRIIALLKNQHRQELLELSEKYQGLGNMQENISTAFIPLHREAGDDTYEYDYEILNDFYDHFKRPGDDQLSYWQIEGYEFESEEHRKAWLIKVATNISKNMMMFRIRKETLNIEDVKNIGICENDYETFELIMSLPSKYKVVMTLYYIEGYKSKEIAEIIGILASLALEPVVFISRPISCAMKPSFLPGACSLSIVSIKYLR